MSIFATLYKSSAYSILFMLFSLFFPSFPLWAQEAAETLQPELPQTVNQMTLMMMIEQGGVILWVIMALGFATVVLAIFLLLTVTVKREVPGVLVERTHKQVHEREFEEAWRMCDERDELLARVFAAGLRMTGHDRFLIQEAMESEGERGATELWQRISYLNNIATIAPLLGLLGTVWGMMQAFSSIAFDTAQVKGMTMAYSVASAMITTAAGLVLAIPAMVIYFLLRGRVIKIIATVESYAAELVEVLSQEQRK